VAKQPVCACRGKYPVGVCGLFFMFWQGWSEVYNRFYDDENAGDFCRKF